MMDRLFAECIPGRAIGVPVTACLPWELPFSMLLSLIAEGEENILLVDRFAFNNLTFDLGARMREGTWQSAFWARGGGPRSAR